VVICKTRADWLGVSPSVQRPRCLHSDTATRGRV